MKNAKLMKAVNDKALISVTGGNDGDKNREMTEDTALYKVGDTVEVFTSLWHIFTKRGTIVYADRVSADRKFTHGNYTKYLVKFDAGGSEWVTADDIERK